MEKNLFKKQAVLPTMLKHCPQADAALDKQKKNRMLE